MTKDKIFNWRFCLCCGFFIWFIVNLLQGIFTEIQEDEAYYHLFGEHLDWGYFDHPPMVALMTFLSSKLFSGTLGVRFCTIIASCLSLFIIWRITLNRLPQCDSETLNRLPQCDSETLNRLPQCDSPTLNNSKLSTLNSQLLFFILAFSVPMFNIYGFVTTPDVGLILFSALFLLVYQRYLAASTWPRAMLMGALMYSKYHAFLLLGLIVLSNLRLLKDGKFYVACLVALALLMPHILWQVNNDFPSFRYHLSGRSEAFRWSYFLEYLPNQLLIFNPFTFWAVVYILVKYRDENVFERSLKFILIGFFFFFWLMAFRGHVEPHWTIVCFIPAVVLVYRKALVDTKLRKYIHRFILPSLLLVVAMRLVLVTPLADRFGYHGKEAYYKAIEKAAGDSPVAFRGSFQQPALYHYFTGSESSTLRAYYDRATQYDLWKFDTAWTGKPVFVCGPVLELSDTIEIDNQLIEGYLMRHFQSPNRLVTDFTILGFGDEQVTIHRGDTLHIVFSVYNPLNETIDFQHNEMPIRIHLLYLLSNKVGWCHYADRIQIAPRSTYIGELATVVGEDIPLGEHRLCLCMGDRVSVFATVTNCKDVVLLEKRKINKGS